MFWNNFPYSDVHNINLDWIIKTVKMLFNSAVFSINGHTPDAEGNVQLTGTELGAIGTVNGKSPDSNGNVDVGTVRTINNQTPNAAGEINVGTVRTVNGFSPDAQGEVKAGTIRSVNGKSPTSTPNPGAITLDASDVGAIPDSVDPVESVNGLTPDANGNVNVGTVKSVNSELPDANGNVNLPTVAGVTSVNGIGPDGNGNVNVGTVKSVNAQTPDSNGNVNVGTVKSVNAQTPDSNGNVALSSSDVGAISNTFTTGPATLETGWSASSCEWYKMGQIVIVKVRTLKNETGSQQSSNAVIATGFPIPLSAIGDSQLLARKNASSSNPNTCIELRIGADGKLKFNFNGAMENNDVVDGYCTYFTN